MDLLFEVVAMAAVLLMGLSPPIASTTKSGIMVEATWCVAKSEASNQAVQTALEYACTAGADCTPIQPTGPCYLPNTIQAHASYAFNSYYQRRGDAPGSCDFAGTAVLSKTDPSYGSCVYPSSPGTAGGRGGTASTTNPYSLPPPLPPGTTTPLSGSGGLTPGLEEPDTNNSKPCAEVFSIDRTILISISCILLLSFRYM